MSTKKLLQQVTDDTVMKLCTEHDDEETTEAENSWHNDKTVQRRRWRQNYCSEKPMTQWQNCPQNTITTKLLQWKTDDTVTKLSTGHDDDETTAVENRWHSDKTVHRTRWRRNYCSRKPMTERWNCPHSTPKDRDTINKEVFTHRVKKIYKSYLLAEVPAH